MATEVGSIVYRVDLDKKGFESGVNSVNNSLKSISANTKTAGADIESSGKGISSTFGNIAAVVGATGLTAAISTFVKNGVSGFANLQASLGQLQGITGASTAQIKQVSDAAVQLGNDLTLPGVSAVDASAAIIELTKAGLSLDDALAAAKPTLQAAKVAGIDFGEAAKIAALNVNAFGLQGTDATKIVDTLTNTFAKSGSTIPELQNALSQSAAVAKNAGLDFNETAAALGVLAKAGLRGSDAGTSLKTTLLRLQAPSAEAARTLEQYGISVRDAAGNMLPLPNIIDNFNSSLSSVGPAAKDAALTDIFGQDAIRSAQIFLSSGGDGLRNFQGEISKTGTASDILKQQTAGLSGAWDALTSQVETIGIQLGAALAPALQKVVQGISTAIQFATEYKDVLIPIGIALGVFATALGAYSIAQFIATGAVAAFNAVLALNPVVLVVAGIIALGAALLYVYNRFEAVRNIVDSFINIFKLLITGDFNGGIFGLEEDSGPVKAFLKIREVAIALGEFIGKQFKQAWDGLVATFNTIKDSFAKLAVAMKPLLDALKAIWERIQGPVLTVLKILGGLILVAIVAPIALAVAAFVIAIVVITKVIQVIAFLIAKLVEIGTAVVTFVAGIISGFISFATAVTNAVTTIWNIIVSIFSTIFNFIFTIFTNVFNFIVSVFTAYYTFIFNTLTTIWNTIVNILTTVWNFIVSVFNNVKDFIVNVFNSIKDWIVARFNEIWAFISNIVQSIYNTIVNTFNTIVDSVRSVFTNVVNTIKGAFDGAIDFLFDAGKNIIDGLINGITSVADKVKNIATDIADNIKDKFKSALGINSPSKVFIGYGQNIVQGLANGVKNLSSVVDYEVAKINPSVDVTGAVTAPSSSSTFSNQQPGGVGGKVNNIFIVSNTLKASESELSDLAEQILYSNPKTRGLIA
jgi:TP901 family phage tail tape measure protein